MTAKTFLKLCKNFFKNFIFFSYKLNAIVIKNLNLVKCFYTNFT